MPCCGVASAANYPEASGRPMSRAWSAPSTCTLLALDPGPRGLRPCLVLPACAACMLPACCLHAACTLPACCLHAACMLPACCLHTTNLHAACTALARLRQPRLGPI